MSITSRPQVSRGLVSRITQTRTAWRDYTIVLAGVGLFVALSLSSSAFFSSTNLLNVANQWAPVAIMGLGSTVVLIGGGFDLSIGAIFAVASVVSVDVSNASTPLLGILAGIGSGVVLGAGNGILVGVIGMNVFVATIGSSIVFAGLATVITGGTSVTATNEGFGWLGNTDFHSIPVAVFLVVLVAAVCWLLLNKSVFGRYVHAVGGNVEAARLSGIRTNRTRATMFVISGIGGGIAGALLASSGLTADGSSYSGQEFAVWTALLLGGNSIAGGDGALWRTMVGVVLLALIQNGCDLLNVSPTVEQVITGCILLAAVSVDITMRNRSGAGASRGLTRIKRRKRGQPTAG